MKCEKAIVLLGKPDSGKTTTLREVSRRLLSIKGAVLKNGRRCLAYLNSASADVTVVIEINGKIVLVRSCGDDEHEIIYTHKLIVKYHCDIVIFAVSMPQKEGGRKAAYRYYQSHKSEFAKEIVELQKIRVEMGDKEKEVGKYVDAVLNCVTDSIAVRQSQSK